MLAVNTRLGYRPFARRLEWERALGSNSLPATVSSTFAPGPDRRTTRKVYVPGGSGSNEPAQQNDPAAPSHLVVAVSISGPPFGACVPSRTSCVRPVVRVRRSTENDAERRTTTLTCTELPVVTNCWRRTDPAPAAPGSARCENGGGDG